MNDINYWPSYLSYEINKLYEIICCMQRQLDNQQSQINDLYYQISIISGGGGTPVTPTATATTLAPGSPATASVIVT